MEHGKVSVPSMGSFILENTNAAFTQNITLLSPPYTFVRYSSSEDEKHRFSDLLYESGISRIDSDLLELLLTRDFLLSKAHNQSFSLNGFGKIENGFFMPSDSSVFNKYVGLEPIVATPVKRAVKNIVHDSNYTFHLEKSYAEREKSGFTEYLWPILLALITSIVIGLWFLTDKKYDINLSNPENITHTQLSNELLPESDPSIYQSDTTKETMDDPEIQPAIDQTVDTPVDNQKPFEKSASDPSDHETCVVIIGAFQNKKYADRMISKIKSKGYKPYQSMYNGLHRVGVSYDCTAKNPENFKEKMKKMFNQQAWHLHDTI